MVRVDVFYKKLFRQSVFLLSLQSEIEFFNLELLKNECVVEHNYTSL